MATFIPALNCLEVALSFTDVTGDENINKFDVERSAPWTAALALTMAEAFITWFETGDGGGGHTYQKLVAANAKLSAVKARDLTTQNGISIVTNAGLPLSGLGDATAVAAGTTFCITHRTGLAGKSFRGRTYMAALGVNSIPTPDLGQVSSGIAVDAVDAFTPLIAAVPAADAEATLVVLSRYGGVPPIAGKSVPRATGLMTPIIAFGYADLNADFQRRRAPGHQRHH